jgi:hypothetical protein
VLWRRVFEMEPICRDTSSKESANAKPSLSSTKIVPIDQLVAAKGF